MTSLAEEKKYRELAVCVQCMLCDDFFMTVVDNIPPPAFFKGKKGQQVQEDLLEELQELHCGLKPAKPARAARSGNHDEMDMLAAFVSDQ